MLNGLTNEYYNASQNYGIQKMPLDKVIKLFNEVIGIKLKKIRLDKGITADAVVRDSDAFKTINGLYKFEKGIISVYKLMVLCNYYDVKIDTILQTLTRKENRCKNSH